MFVSPFPGVHVQVPFSNFCGNSSDFLSFFQTWGHDHLLTSRFCLAALSVPCIFHQAKKYICVKGPFLGKKDEKKEIPSDLGK